MITKVGKDSVTPAVEWAQNLKEEGIVEEFSLGPTTLEDAYVRMVGRLDALELPDGGT